MLIQTTTRILVLLSCFTLSVYTVTMEPTKNRVGRSLSKSKRKIHAIIRKHPLDIENLKLPDDINKKDELGNTPLMYALEKGKMKSIETLLQYTDQLDRCSNAFGRTPYHIAAEKGPQYLTKLLNSQYHLDMINEEDYEGDTPLLCAVKKGNIESVMWLLSCDDITIDHFNNNGLTAGHEAAKKNADLFTLFINDVRLRDINVTDFSGNTFLIYATQNSIIHSVAQLLTDPKTNLNHPNKSGNTAAHFAAMQGNHQLLELFIADSRFDASIQNCDNKTVHECLAYSTYNYKNMRNLLHRHCIYHIPEFNNENLFDAKQIVRKNHISDYVNAIRTKGISPLIWAVGCYSQEEISIQQQKGIKSFIKKLISYPALKINYRNTYFGTALHYAVYLGLLDIVELLLLNYRTNPSIRNSCNLQPHDCIIKESTGISEKLGILLFSRAWLYNSINQITFNLIIEGPFHELIVEYQLTPTTVEAILNAIIEQKEKENGVQATILPENELPHYATHEFIKDMIKYIYVSPLIDTPTTHHRRSLNTACTRTISTTSTSSSTNQRSCSTNEGGNTHLVHIIQHNGLETLIEPLLKSGSIDVNCQNHGGMTALHYAALNNNRSQVMLLLHQPQTQASLKNTDKRCAYELVQKTDVDSELLHNMLLARIYLEAAVSAACTAIKKAYHNEWCQKSFTKDEQCISAAVQTIRSKVFRDEIIQEITKQPELEITQLLDYADDAFITEMIMARLYTT